MITVGEYKLPYPVGEAGAPTGESLKHSDRTLIWMVDAQTALRAADAGGILIGSNSSHERAVKTGRFVDTAHAFDARSLNTWEENSAPVYVCIHEPGSSANRVPGVKRRFADRCSVEVFDSSATSSDHRALLLKVRGRQRTHSESTTFSQTDWLETHGLAAF